MKKSFKLIFLILVFLLSFSGCTNKNYDNTKDQDKLSVEEVKTEEVVNVESGKIDRDINVVVPSGTPALSIVKMISEKYSPEGYNVNYEVITSTDLLTSKILSKEADILIIPTNLAAKLHSKGVEYKLKSINVWGSLYIVANGENKVNTIQDLSGKEIYTIGEGLTPDLITKYILKENGIKDAKFIYLSGATELSPTFLAGKSEISLMPEPLLSLVKTKKSDTKIVVDLQKEWAKLSDGLSSYPQSGLYINNELLLDDEFINKFLDEVDKSITWLNENPSEAGIYYEALGVSPPAKVIENSIPGSNIKFAKTSDVKGDLTKYFEILLSESPDSIGGMVPDESLYE